MLRPGVRAKLSHGASRRRPPPLAHPTAAGGFHATSRDRLELTITRVDDRCQARCRPPASAFSARRPARQPPGRDFHTYSLWVVPAPAVDERLISARGRVVCLPLRSGQSESLTEGRMQAARRVPLNGQSAATRRPILGERRYNDMTARPYHPAYLLDVSIAFGHVSQKVKHRTVVPHIDTCRSGRH